MVSDEGSKPEVLARIARTVATLTKLDIIWKDKAIKLSSKIRLMHSLINSVFLFACETWTLTAELEKRALALEIDVSGDCSASHTKTTSPMRKSETE